MHHTDSTALPLPPTTGSDWQRRPQHAVLIASKEIRASTVAAVTPQGSCASRSVGVWTGWTYGESRGWLGVSALKHWSEGAPCVCSRAAVNTNSSITHTAGRGRRHALPFSIGAGESRSYDGAIQLLEGLQEQPERHGSTSTTMPSLSAQQRTAETAAAPGGWSRSGGGHNGGSGPLAAQCRIRTSSSARE